MLTISQIFQYTIIAPLVKYHVVIGLAPSRGDPL